MLYAVEEEQGIGFIDGIVWPHSPQALNSLQKGIFVVEKGRPDIGEPHSVNVKLRLSENPALALLPHTNSVVADGLDPREKFSPDALAEMNQIVQPHMQPHEVRGEIHK